MNITSAKSVTVPKPHFGLSALSYNQNTLLRQQKLSRGLNEETVKTVQELTYKWAMSGDSKDLKKVSEYISKCWRNIEPDRKKLFAEAEAKACMAKRTSAKSRLPEDELSGIWKYMFKKKSIAPDVAGGLSDGKSFAANIRPSRTYIEVYNENGEVLGCYDSVNAPDWHTTMTTEEHQCYDTLSRIYCDAYNKYKIYAEAGILTDTDPAAEQAQMTESLDIYV